MKQIRLSFPLSHSTIKTAQMVLYSFNTEILHSAFCAFLILFGSNLLQKQESTRRFQGLIQFREQLKGVCDGIEVFVIISERESSLVTLERVV